MKTNKVLSEAEDNWITNIGAAFAGERVVYRGKDLLYDLNSIRWMGLLLLGITGKEFSENQIKLFETLWTLGVSYPDPRIWNNRVAALAGTARSTTGLACSGALAVSDAQIYGGRANIAAIDFIIDAKNQVDDGEDINTIIRNELKVNRAIYGYGRPIVNRDERIQPILSVAENLGFAEGPHLKLAGEIEKILYQGRWRMRMNVTGLAAALGADQGLSTREYYSWATNAFLAGIVPCYIDAKDHPEGAFFPLSCSRIAYRGHEMRSW